MSAMTTALLTVGTVEMVTAHNVLLKGNAVLIAGSAAMATVNAARAIGIVLPIAADHAVTGFALSFPEARAA